MSDAVRGVALDAGLGSSARGIKKLSLSTVWASDACEMAECRFLRYVVVGSVNPSLLVASPEGRSGERSGGRRELSLEDGPFCEYP